MFEGVTISWVATADPPGSNFDAYSDGMRLHRFDISDWIPRGNDSLANLSRFCEAWSNASPNGKTVLFLTSYTSFDFPNLEQTNSLLPDGVYLVIFARQYQKSSFERIVVIGLPKNDNEDIRYRTGAALARLIRLQDANSPLATPEQEFNFEPVEFDSIDAFTPSVDENKQVRIDDDGIRFDFLSTLTSAKSDRHRRGLLVIGQSALVRSSVQIPHFQRWTWAKDFVGGSALILNDPAHHLSEELDAGWWFGTTSRDLVADMARIVGKCVDALGISNDDVVFFGGSAGGFASFHMASKLRGSRVVADIPQIDMRKYHLPAPAHNAAKAAFGVDTIDAVPEDLLYRIDVVERIKRERYLPSFLYLQNTRDGSHYSSQFAYFMTELMKIQAANDWAQKPVKIEAYRAWHLQRGGHFPLDRADTMDRINEYFLSTRPTSPT